MLMRFSMQQGSRNACTGSRCLCPSHHYAFDSGSAGLCQLPTAQGLSGTDRGPGVIFLLPTHTVKVGSQQALDEARFTRGLVDVVVLLSPLDTLHAAVPSRPATT